MLWVVAEIAVGVMALIWGTRSIIVNATAKPPIGDVIPKYLAYVTVALAVSVPELVISGTAAFTTAPEQPVNIAIGSNISNIALSIGVAAMLRPVPICIATAQRQLPILLAVSLLFATTVLDSVLSFVDGWTLLGGLLVVSTWMAVVSRAALNGAPFRVGDCTYRRVAVRRLASAGMAALAGIVCISFAGLQLAQSAGPGTRTAVPLVSTVTSLPELVIVLVAVIAGKSGLALTTVVGANIVNSLAVAGIASVLAHSPIVASGWSMPIIVMSVFTIFLFAITCGDSRKRAIARYEGLSLLIALAAYYLYASATSSFS